VQVEFYDLLKQDLSFFSAELSAVQIELKFHSVVTTLVQESKAMPVKGVSMYRTAFHVLA